MAGIDPYAEFCIATQTDLPNLNFKRDNATEIWNFINTTPNDYPMHVQQVTIEVLSRRLYDVNNFNATGEIKFTGQKMLPPNENGRRDMVRALQARRSRLLPTSICRVCLSITAI